MVEVGVAPSGLSDWLIGQGRHFISAAEAACVLGVGPESVSASLERPRLAGKLVSVTKGGWVPVPAEYRSAGAPPPAHFVDQLMEHLGHRYYVGFLSAAAMYGASHQAPMVLQVATSAKLRERKVGRGRIRFTERSTAADRPRRSHSVPTGRIWVSTPEVTVFDLVEELARTLPDAALQRVSGIDRIQTAAQDALRHYQPANTPAPRTPTSSLPSPQAEAIRAGYVPTAPRSAGATTSTGKRTLRGASSSPYRQAYSIRVGCVLTAVRSAGAAMRRFYCHRDSGSSKASAASVAWPFGVPLLTL